MEGNPSQASDQKKASEPPLQIQNKPLLTNTAPAFKVCQTIEPQPSRGSAEIEQGSAP